MRKTLRQQVTKIDNFGTRGHGEINMAHVKNMFKRTLTKGDPVDPYSSSLFSSSSSISLRFFEDKDDDENDISLSI